MILTRRDCAGPDARRWRLGEDVVSASTKSNRLGSAPVEPEPEAIEAIAAGEASGGNASPKLTLRSLREVTAAGRLAEEFLVLFMYPLKC